MDDLDSMPVTAKNFPSSTHFTDAKSGPTSLPVHPTGTKAEDEKLFQSLVPPQHEARVEKHSVSVSNDKPQGMS